METARDKAHFLEEVPGLFLLPDCTCKLSGFQLQAACEKSHPIARAGPGLITQQKQPVQRCEMIPHIQNLTFNL